MGRVISTSGFVGVAGRSWGRRLAPLSLGRLGAPRLPAAWIASALGIGAGALVTAAAMHLAEALRTPGFGGFPPIP
jgi:hypothetical protein